MKFVFQRNRVVASLYGHVLDFKKGVPTHVPPECYAEVVAAGGIPEDGEELDLDPPKKEAKQEPVDPVSRKKAIFDAFETLSLRGKRTDFTAGGAPHGKALEAELGWNVSNKERDLLWVEFQTAGKDE
jgi:hypothetical protein